jgi:phenylalanyl-tRNA synthetase alpha chain
MQNTNQPSSFAWTELQKKRLQELQVAGEQEERRFSTEEDRDRAFRKEESGLKAAARNRLNDLLEHTRRPALCRLETQIVEALTGAGFVQVTTPTILAKSMLAKMTIDDQHALFSQVFWLDDKRCLRPMLAPNLYFVLKDLVRLWPKPVRIFEIGSCFRKESQGNNHLSEFTMLNLVEWGLAEADRHARLSEMAQLVMQTTGIQEYQMERESSVVYGDTVDVVHHGLELGSGAMGPHALDGNWGMTGAWVGIGFGLERLTMIREGGRNVRSVGKGLTYLDGVRLNI